MSDKQLDKAKKLAELGKAQAIVARVIAQRKQWGKHAGFAEYSEDDVLDALVAIGDAGFLEYEGGGREAVVAANRAKGAAEARAAKYKGQLDHANKQIKDLTIALEDAENEVTSLQEQLQESLDA